MFWRMCGAAFAVAVLTTGAQAETRCYGLASCGGSGLAGQLNVLGGTAEPDYKYPWVVRSSSGCGGVLLDPRWVLTAAHCVDNPNLGKEWSFTRTDPYTDAIHTDQRNPIWLPNKSVFLHPMYDPKSAANDIALVKLAPPFPIDPYLQTVALPTIPRQANQVGTVASKGHHVMLPPGTLDIFRAPIPPDIPGAADPTHFDIRSTDTSGWLCKGDSGSGFVTYENGRATVRGIVSQSDDVLGNCIITPRFAQTFTDVFTFRDWILETMRANGASGENTRVRWEGFGFRGVMGIGCLNPYSVAYGDPYATLWGPLNVQGVEVAANCNRDETQTVLCSLNSVQPGPAGLRPAIKSFTMTTVAGGNTSVQALPVSNHFAAFFGIMPAGAARTFTCLISHADFDITTGGNQIVQ